MAFLNQLFLTEIRSSSAISGKNYSPHGDSIEEEYCFSPQTDGQTERVNQCLETYMRCFCNEQPHKWDKFIPWAELWYNTTFHASTRSNPFEIVYGRQPPLISYGSKKTSNNEVEAMLKERDLAECLEGEFECSPK